MSTKRILVAAVAAMALGLTARAQTNIQVLYDFGKDRQILTTTLEGFYNDNWGNTFFFIDYDYPLNDAFPAGTYFEFARCLNFWHGTFLEPLSIQVEYNGGVYNQYGINHAALAGLDLFFHSRNFKNTFNLKALYKWISYKGQPDGYKSLVPMQFTAVWGFQDLFGLRGLRFCGFADFWWQDHTLTYDEKGNTLTYPEKSRLVFLSEPQLWYSVGQFIGVPNFNIGGEVELSYDFGSCRGFRARPCAGIKWVF